MTRNPLNNYTMSMAAVEDNVDKKYSRIFLRTFDGAKSELMAARIGATKVAEHTAIFETSGAHGPILIMLN